LGIDGEAHEVLLPVHRDLDHAAARAGLDAQGGDLLLDALLRLLELLHQLLWVHQRSESRTSTTRPPNRSSASCTAGSRETSAISFCRRRSAGSSGGAVAAGSVATIRTFNGLPVAARASSWYSGAWAEA